VAATDPFNLHFVNEIKKAYPFNVELVLAPENAVMEAIEIVFGRLDRTLAAGHEGDHAADESGPPRVSASEELERVIRRALQLRAREIQFFWKNGRLTVFYLTQTMVPEQKDLHSSMFSELLKVLKIRAKIPLESAEGFHEGLFTVETPEKQIFFRVHIFTSPLGATVTFKLS
jgi:type II secretory ATPase GspE/PulE/Tfp pilus assembly ATPase PilB-like protein